MPSAKIRKRTGGAQFVDVTIGSMGESLVGASDATTAQDLLGIPRTLFAHHDDAANGTTAETDLYSDTIAANLLNATDRRIEFMYSGLFLGSTSSKRLRIYYDTNLLLDTGAVAIAVSGKWVVRGTIINQGTSRPRCSVTVITGTATPLTFVADLSTAGIVDFTLDTILKITGTASSTGAASSDIIARQGNVTYWPAP